MGAVWSSLWSCEVQRCDCEHTGDKFSKSDLWLREAAAQLSASGISSWKSPFCSDIYRKRMCCLPLKVFPTRPGWWDSCFTCQPSSAHSILPFVCGTGRKQWISLKLPIFGNCNEGVARLPSIGAIVYSYMDSVVLQGTSVTHNALHIPLLFQNWRGGGRLMSVKTPHSWDCFIFFGKISLNT